MPIKWLQERPDGSKNEGPGVALVQGGSAMQATGRLAAASAGVFMCVGMALLLQGSGRGGVELEGTGKDASPKHAVDLLASLYSEPCHVPTPHPIPAPSTPNPEP